MPALEDVDSDPDFEEPEELRKIKAVRAPTESQRRQHIEENHSTYREWCDVCIAARATGTQHRRQYHEQAKKEEEGPRLCSGYFFMSTEEESMPMLALKNSRSGRISATAPEKKGLTEFGTRFFARFIQSSGLPRFMN